MNQGDGATLERADKLAKDFRGEMGLGGEEPAYGMAAEARGGHPGVTRGLELSDVDGLLRQHEERAYQVGYNTGADEMFARCRRQHEVELGQYMAGAFQLVESDVLSAIVVAAVKARDSKATRGEIVQAVIDVVKREGAALNDMAHRARTGGLFS